MIGRTTVWQRVSKTTENLVRLMKIMMMVRNLLMEWIDCERLVIYKHFYRSLDPIQLSSELSEELSEDLCLSKQSQSIHKMKWYKLVVRSSFYPLLPLNFPLIKV